MTGRRLAARLVGRQGAAAHRRLLAVAAVAFVGAAVLGWRSLPDFDASPRYWVLAIAVLVAAPATAAANGLEYALTARLLGHRVAVPEAVRIAVLSSAANLLPLPGAVAVRAQALRRRGASTSSAVSATAVAGIAWIGIALVLAGALHAAAESIGLGLGATGVGAALIAVSAITVRVSTGRHQPGNTVLIVGAEVLSVAVGAGRYLVVLWGLGFDVVPRQALALAVAGILASLVGILPGGLGVRELLAGAIAPLVGLAAAVGVVGSAVDRLVGLPGLAVLALIAAARQPEAETSEGDAARSPGEATAPDLGPSPPDSARSAPGELRP